MTEINIPEFKAIVKSGKVGKKAGSSKARDNFFAVVETYVRKKYPDVIIEKEFKFKPGRKWRADMALICNTIADILIEFEGIMSVKSRHTGVVGYSNDASKYNAAQIQGFTVLRYTVLNQKEIFDDLDKLLK